MNVLHRAPSLCTSVPRPFPLHPAFCLVAPPLSATPNRVWWPRPFLIHQADLSGDFIPSCYAGWGCPFPILTLRAWPAVSPAPFRYIARVCLVTPPLWLWPFLLPITRSFIGFTIFCYIELVYLLTLLNIFIKYFFKVK